MLKQFVQTWLSEVKGDALKDSTRATYQDLLDLHVIPHLGSLQLERITPQHLLAWQSEPQRQSVGDRTRRSSFVLLHGILETAVQYNMLPGNPARHVPRPKAATKRRAALEPKQVRALLDAARQLDGARQRGAEAIVALGVLHGLRLGECLGLLWKDVDFDALMIRVERQLSEERRSGKRELETPKSSASVRDVPLSRIAIEALRRHRAQLGTIPHPTALIFEAPNGGAIRRSNWHRRVWDPIRKAAGLPGLRFHDLRHAAASALLGAGVDVATTAATLGHSSAATTLRVYSHSIPGKQREAADRVDELYGGGQKA